MDEKLYDQLLKMSLKLRITESALVEALEEIKKSNAVLREILLKEAK